MAALTGSVRGSCNRAGQSHIGVAQERKRTERRAGINHSIEGDADLVASACILAPFAGSDSIFPQGVGAVIRQLLDLLCRNLGRRAGGTPVPQGRRQQALSSQRQTPKASQHQRQSERENESLTLHPASSKAILVRLMLTPPEPSRYCG